MFPFPVRALNEKDAELHNQEKFEKLLAMLDELDDVSNVYHNVEL